MANLIYCHSATAATFDTVEVGTPTNVFTEPTITKYGARSLRIGNDGEIKGASGVLADAGRRLNTWFRKSANPSAASVILGAIDSAGTAFVLTANVSTGGVLQLMNGDGSVIASGSTLSNDTWYRVCFVYTITTTTNWSAKIYLDTVDGHTQSSADISATNADATLTRTGASRFYCVETGAVNFYWAPVVIDDGTDLSDMGDIRVVPKLFNALTGGTQDFDTAIGGAATNRYDRVNERALSETRGWQQAASTVGTETYAIEGAATGDIDVSSKTIVGHLAWCWAKAAASDAGAKLVRNGVDVAISLTVSSAYYYDIATSATYPSGVFGMKSTGSANDTFFYEGGALIIFDNTSPSGLGKLILRTPA